MKSIIFFALYAITVFLANEARADMPARINFTARLVNESTVFDGPVQITFHLFRASSEGSSVWNESHSTMASAGLVALAIGDQSPLDATIIDGNPLYLEVAINNTVLSPRLPIGSVPYALLAARAESAIKLGALRETDVQRRVAGSCPTESSIRAIDSAGEISCQPDEGFKTLNTSGGINSSISGRTLSISTDSTIQRRSAVTNNMSCPTGQYMRTIKQTGEAACAPALTCSKRTGTLGSTSSASCLSGSIVMGGGCSSPSNTAILDSYPDSTSSWACRTSSTSTVQAMAICCDVSF